MVWAVHGCSCGLTVIAMIVMVIVVVRRVHGRRTVLKHDQNWKALKRMLPLAVYPILFLVFIVVPLANRLYGALRVTSESNQMSHNLSIVQAVSKGCWNLSTGVVIIIHVSLARVRRRSTIVVRNDTAVASYHHSGKAEDCVTVSNCDDPSSNCSTWFAPPASISETF